MFFFVRARKRGERQSRFGGQFLWLRFVGDPDGGRRGPNAPDSIQRFFEHLDGALSRTWRELQSRAAAAEERLRKKWPLPHRFPPRHFLEVTLRARNLSALRAFYRIPVRYDLKPFVRGSFRPLEGGGGRDARERAQP